MIHFFLQTQVQYFKEDDPIAALVLLIGAGGILFFILVLNLVRHGLKLGKKPQKGISTRHYSVFAMRRAEKKYGLNRGYSKLLEYIFKSNGVTDPERTLANPPVLDKHFKRAIKEIENSPASENEIQQKLAFLFSLRNVIDIYHNTSAGDPSTQKIASGMEATLGVNQESYQVKVMSTKDESIMVDCPRNRVGSLIKFQKGTTANLSFIAKDGKNFSFDIRIVGMTNTTFGDALHLIGSKQAKSMTQRRYRRKQALLNCYFFLINLVETKKKKAPKMTLGSTRYKGNITDISIGGCAIKTQNAVSVGSRIKIEFEDSKSPFPMAVLGQVLRINRTGIGNTVMYIKFIKIPRKAMNSINFIVFDYGD
ncbi:MAG: PilZ domain-containing protein [Treponema sp.]|jgi:c-di-GMP-binding flagellar brake protein YcgR|nr:PilZ domain-containing protein [Treponema sp.]